MRFVLKNYDLGLSVAELFPAFEKCMAGIVFYQDLVSINYQLALNRSQIGTGRVRLDELFHEVEARSGWSILVTNENFETDQWLEYISNKQFPVILGMRGEHEIHAAMEPDFFHDLVGHLPYFWCDQYIEVMNIFSERWERTDNEWMALMFRKIWYFFFEFSVLKSPNGVVALGSGIISSSSQLQRLREMRVACIPYDKFIIEDGLIDESGNPECFVLFDSLEHWSACLSRVFCESAELLI